MCLSRFWVVCFAGMLLSTPYAGVLGDDDVVSLSPRWLAPTALPPTRRPIEDALKRHAENGECWLPGDEALTSGEWIIVAAHPYTIGVEPETGKRVWQFPWSDFMAHESPVRRPSARPTGREISKRAFDSRNLQFRAAEGDLVYAVDPITAASDVTPRRRVIIPRIASQKIHAPNWFVRLDTNFQGKMVWGWSSVSEPEAIPELLRANVHGFAVSKSRLVCCTEKEGSLKLAVIHVDGEADMNWAQVLAGEQTRPKTTYRQYVGCAIVIHDDLALCVTNGGKAFAVNLAAKETAWEAEYDAKLRALSADRWQRIRPMAVGERVLLTPPDSDELVCVKKSNGEQAWTHPRGGGVYADVWENTVLVVEPTAIRFLRLDDGEELGKPLLLPKDAMVTGAGCIRDGEFLQPITDGRIARIDLTARRIKGCYQLEGCEAGNLMLWKQSLITHGPLQAGRFELP